MDKGKKSFLMMLALFLAPVILGTLLFFGQETFGFKFNKGGVNYGTLIQPAFPVKVDGLMNGDAPARIDQSLSKKWTMLYIETLDCDQFCRDRLLLMKRVRLLMNEQMRRVRTVFVTSKNVTDITREKDKNLQVTQVESTQSAFLKQFPDKDGKPIYLLDPLGNLMMYYPQKQPNAKKMIKDLKKLLKYSRLG